MRLQRGVFLLYKVYAVQKKKKIKKQTKRADHPPTGGKNGKKLK